MVFVVAPTPLLCPMLTLHWFLSNCNQKAISAGRDHWGRHQVSALGLKMGLFFCQGLDFYTSQDIFCVLTSNQCSGFEIGFVVFSSGLWLLHFPFSKFTRCLLWVYIKSVLWVWNWGCFFLVGLELVHIRFSKFTRCFWCVDINAVLEIERNALVIIVLLLFLSFYLSHLIFSTSPHLTGHWT